MRQYNIIAIIGESGSGKDKLVRRLCEKLPEKAHKIVNSTTRPPRQGEVDGIDYHFISHETFLRLITEGKMIEATYFNEWFYGTEESELRTDKINIGVFNPESVDIITTTPDAHHINIIPYLLHCSDKERLLRQINREDDPNIEEIVRRFEADRKDFSDIEFSYIPLRNEDEEDFERNLKTIGEHLSRLFNLLE